MLVIIQYDSAPAKDNISSSNIYIYTDILGGISCGLWETIYIYNDF